MIELPGKITLTYQNDVLASIKWSDVQIEGLKEYGFIFWQSGWLACSVEHFAWVAQKLMDYVSAFAYPEMLWEKNEEESVYSVTFVDQINSVNQELRRLEEAIGQLTKTGVAKVQSAD